MGKKRYCKAVICIMIFLCALLVNPFKMTAYATGYSGSPHQEYTLELIEADEKKEQIKGSEIGLKYHTHEEFKNLTGNRKLKRVSEFTYTDASGVTIGVTFDEKLLKEAVDKLSCFDENNVIEPKNAGFIYTEEGYVIIDEVYGNKVNKSILYRNVVNAIRKMETSVDLTEINCYIKPQYTSESQKAVEVKDMLNRCVSSKITYSFGENSEVLDGSLIKQWLLVDENLEVSLDEEKVKNYIDGFSKYNTAGKPRDFVTSSGKVIKINSGGLTWVVNTAKEVKDLTAAIKDGLTITKLPAYRPGTFVEIDLSRQHLWFYKNGSLVIDGDVVTGDVRRGLKTPEGVYKLNYKRRYAILRGPGYVAPVDYWMPFNGGIGIHDASWRRKFGGEIYKRDGSHGCINCPYSMAKTIYENIDVGTLIICYY